MLGYTVVNVIFKNSPVQLGFTFKGYKSAEDMVRKFNIADKDVAIDLEDDFGCKATILTETVAAIVLNDIDKEIKRSVDTRIEQDLEMNRRVREEQAKPANQIMMPANKPIVANAQ